MKTSKKANKKRVIDSDKESEGHNTSNKAVATNNSENTVESNGKTVKSEVSNGHEADTEKKLPPKRKTGMFIFYFVNKQKFVKKVNKKIFFQKFLNRK